MLLRGATMRKFLLGLLMFFAALGPCLADSQGSATGGTAGTQSTLGGGIYNSSPPTLTSGQQAGFQFDANGNLKVNSSGTPAVDHVVTDTGSVTNTTPAQRTIVALDVATVTTGGTAVTALIAGHRTAGGFLLNPIGATINLCINEQATASGTTSAGALTCILPGQSYTLAPAAGAVSVITSDSTHPFSGEGLN